MLIIESVAEGSAAAQAGMEVGDHLLTYDGQPLASPAALLALEENTFGRESVRIQIERGREPRVLTIAIGKLGVEVRRELPAALRGGYEAGQEAFATGQYALAAEAWNEAAERTLSHFDDRDSPASLNMSVSAAPDTPEALRAWLWSRAGEAWEKGSERQKALEAYQAAWEGWQQTGDAAEQVQIAIAMGRCYENRSQWDEAAAWYEQARKIGERAGWPIWEASVLNNLDRVAWQRGDLATAWDYSTRALQINERIAPGSLSMAKSLSHLGIVASKRGDQEVAQDYFSRAFQIHERLAPDSLDIAASLNSLGVCADERGDLSMAQDFYIRALQIYEHLAPHSLYVSRSLTNLGAVAWRRGDLPKAQTHFDHALQIREHLAPASLDMAESLNCLGALAKDRGDLAMAQDYYMRALQIKEHLAPGSLDVAYSLNDLGAVAVVRGDLAMAQDYNTRALQIKERLAPDSVDVAMSLNNMGDIACQRGDLATAQEYHIRALQIKERLAPDSLSMAYSLNNLGTVAKKRGDLVTAQDFYTRALQIRERLAPNSLNHVDSLTDLGDILLRQRFPAQALPLLLQAVQIIEQQRQSIVAPEARALLLAQHTGEYAALIRCYLALQQPDQAFTTLERSRARSLLELLAERRLDFAADTSPELLQQQQDLDRQRATTYDQLARINAEDSSRIAALRQQLRDLERQQQELTARIRSVSPRYADLKYAQPLTARQAKQALPSGTLLLSYLIDEQQTYLFAVTRKRVQVFTLPVGRNALQQHVHALRSALDLTALENRLAFDQNQPQADQLSHHLYTLLLAPAQELIHNARRLLLCADGPLHLLPWPALVMRPGNSPRYLGQSKPLSTTLSMTLYAQSRYANLLKQSLDATAVAESTQAAETSPIRQRAATARPFMPRLLALGDPLYTSSPTANSSPAFARTVNPDNVSHASDAVLLTSTSQLEQWQTRGLRLDSLPHTRAEVEAIQELFGEQAQVKLGSQATKTMALQLAPTADVVHFACHGWLDAVDPLASGLILTQPQALGAHASQNDNGLLQAWEILSRLKIEAELVVLSACQSGLGQEVRGEGLVGLTRAFQYAGARSLLVSLWEVHDAGTSLFMQAFYTGLKQGMSKGASVRRAIRRLRQDRRYRHPYYWSAFLLQGEG
jgi:CHAT domain-containing protein/Tfp pilus assembly protein PilF